MSEKPYGEVICQRCHRKNGASALTCAWCGAPLTSDTTTMRVNDSLTQDHAHTPRSGTSGEGISLYIAGEVQPLVIREKRRFILGRHSKDQSSAVIDLTPYKAGILGVSRRHVMVAVVDQTYTIEDLGSTNGTWLNEKPLPAHTPFILRNGDQVRLGHLILFVYLTSQPTRQTITLKETRFGEEHNCTPHYLAISVSPYLKALIGVQGVIDQLGGRTPTRVDIESINVSARESTVSVSLAGAGEAIELVHDQVNPWKQKYAGLIERLRALEGMRTPAGEAEKERLRRELCEAQADLAGSLISRDHTVAPTENGALVEQLLPHLHTLILSTLDIVYSRVEADENDRVPTPQP
jgi:hypothetical protein